MLLLSTSAMFIVLVSVVFLLLSTMEVTSLMMLKPLSRMPMQQRLQQQHNRVGLSSFHPPQPISNTMLMAWPAAKNNGAMKSALTTATTTSAATMATTAAKSWLPSWMFDEAVIELFRRSFSLLFCIGFFFTLGTVLHYRNEKTFEKNLKKEMKRIDQVKEDLYIEAVREILQNLSDPKIKQSAKDQYMRELKDLDPQGTIQAHVSKGAPRPDFTNIIGRRSSNKTKTSSSTASTTTTSAKKDNSELFDQVLKKLMDNLEKDMDTRERNIIRVQLAQRAHEANPEKRAIIIQRINSKIDDIKYWKEYVRKLTAP